MNLTDLEDIIAPIKGAAASILIALLVHGGSLTNKQLCQVCRYSDKPITQALGYLEGKKYVQNNGQFIGWSVRQGTQLPLPWLKLAAPYAELSTGYPQVGLEDRNYSDLLPPPPPNIEGTISGIAFKAAEGGKAHKDRNISDLLPHQQKAFAICRDFQVGVKKARELAKLEWGTPEYLTAIFNQYKHHEDLTPRNRIAYAIQAISDHDDPLPTTNTCPDCGRAINPRLSFCTHCAINS